jgi:AcrR family transcriptional regulator
MGKRARGSEALRAYHHGNLRPALIGAGMQILEREGVDGVSLRAVARQARVSHSAPYHHFANKAALLAALAAAGFDRLLEAFGEEATQSGTNDPWERLRATGRAYVLFAMRHPSVFRLMFRPELTRPIDHPMLQEAEARAFGGLVETIVACQQLQRLPDSDSMQLAAFAWSTVHGLATLFVDQVLNETPLAALPLQKILPSLIDRCMAGLAYQPAT